LLLVCLSSSLGLPIEEINDTKEAAQLELEEVPLEKDVTEETELDVSTNNPVNSILGLFGSLIGTVAKSVGSAVQESIQLAQQLENLPGDVERMVDYKLYDKHNNVIACVKSHLKITNVGRTARCLDEDTQEDAVVVTDGNQEKAEIPTETEIENFYEDDNKSSEDETENEYDEKNSKKTDEVHQNIVTIDELPRKIA